MYTTLPVIPEYKDDVRAAEGQCRSSLAGLRCDGPKVHEGEHEHDTGGAVYRWTDEQLRRAAQVIHAHEVRWLVSEGYQDWRHLVQMTVHAYERKHGVGEDTL